MRRVTARSTAISFCVMRVISCTHLFFRILIRKQWLHCVRVKVMRLHAPGSFHKASYSVWSNSCLKPSSGLLLCFQLCRKVHLVPWRQSGGPDIVWFHFIMTSFPKICSVIRCCKKGVFIHGIPLYNEESSCING